MDSSNKVKVLHGGIYIDYQCNGITNIPEGIFISFTPNNKQAMEELEMFLRKYGYLQEDENIFPQYCFRESLIDYAKRTGKVPVYTPEGIIEIEREALRGKR